MVNEADWIMFFGQRVLVATICGLIIGWERELKSKVAGIRTNVLVCVGSAILTSIAYVLTIDYAASDRGRIIGQIVTGVGFLGGGVIFKMGDKITGVTTASFTWVMCALGIMAGMGFTYITVGLAVVILLLSLLFRVLERKIDPRYRTNSSEDGKEV